MLLFVGTGIDGVRGLSIAALEELRKCDIVYAEDFTSHISGVQLSELSSLIGKQVSTIPRWYIEDGREILERAKNEVLAIVSYGDPLTATTHAELRVRASKMSVKTRVFHAASGILSL